MSNKNPKNKTNNDTLDKNSIELSWHEFKAGGDGEAVPVMTSFQAAELLGKCHPEVMWMLRKLLPKLPKTFRENHIERFETIQRSVFNRKKMSAYYLSKTGCELLMSMCRRNSSKNEEITLKRMRAFGERFREMEREREAVVVVTLVTV